MATISFGFPAARADAISSAAENNKKNLRLILNGGARMLLYCPSS
jgi:hypothetical protein